jgi:hypothetical protein
MIAFISNAPEVLEVESIVVSKDISKASISDKNYTDYVKSLKAQKLPVNYSDIKKAAIESEKSSSHLKSYKLSNPEGNYDHEMELDFNYTYYTTLSLTAGQTITLETKNATSDPVLQLFNSIDPINKGSWTDDDGAGNGYNSKITATIQYAGTYYVLIRKFINPSSVVGTCDLYKDGSLFVSNVAVAGSGIRCDKNVTEELNYFTRLASGDTRIWIEDQTGFPGLIVAYNDDYSSSDAHDFEWGYASRVKQNLYRNIRAVIVSNYSASNPAGKCDLYMNCKNSNVADYFPNLKANDAIQSAPQSGTYNCISWSGGITNYWEWPDSPYSSYYVPGNPLGSFDKFYQARGFTRTGASSSNSIVDLWALNGDYTHGSVKKPGNNFPHGYDWESKPGGLMRTFHPRNALNGPDYGNVLNYYIPVSGLKSAKLLDEEIAEGTAVIENVELTSQEKTIIDNSIEALTIDQKSTVEEKYQAWKDTWNNSSLTIQSNPKLYARSNEYKELIKYCKGQGKVVWPIIFDKFQQGDFFAINAIEDLTLDENKDVLEKVKKGNNLKSASESGATIYRSPQGNTLKYIKELLKSSNAATSINNNGISYSNSLSFNIYPNPVEASSKISFELSQDAKVSVSVIDLSGKYLSIPITEQSLSSGNYSFNLQIPSNYKGVCLVRLSVNNNLNVQKIIVQ